MHETCVICGDKISAWPHNARHISAAEFRALIVQAGFNNSKLTGVGLYSSQHAYTIAVYVAPQNYSARWDDEGYQRPDSDRIYQNSNERTFLLHAYCCALLEQIFRPKPIPIARLAEVCCSCPVQDIDGGHLIWGPGHNYKGRLRLEDRCLWEEPCIISRTRSSWNPSFPRGPGGPIKLANYLQRPAQTRKSGKARRKKLKSAKTSQGKLIITGNIISNCFTKLPLEILEHILADVPMDGVKSLAQASKGLKIVIPSGLGQVFWASRFKVPLDCAFLVEIWKYEAKVNWKTLYMAIERSGSHEIKNRRRIWNLVQSLSELLYLQWNDCNSLIPPDDEEKATIWVEARGDLAIEQGEFGHSITKGCLRFHTQSTAIPHLLCRVVVSHISIGSATYITGLRFISSSGPDVCLGYTKGIESSLEIMSIQGFVLAVGSRGIHAMQFVTHGKELSQWFGNSSGIPQTYRLVPNKPVVALQAGFDGFKMVSCAILDNAELREQTIPFKIPHIDPPCSTYYKIIGSLSSESPPLIILHGGPGTGHEYLLPFGLLWQQFGIPVVLYDQIGCAASTHLPETNGDKTFWQEKLFVDELNNLVDSLRLHDGPGYSVLGHGWGGIIAAAFATTQPHGLQRLILASAIASSQSWVDGIKIVCRQLPSGVQLAIKEMEESGTDDNARLQNEMSVFFRTYSCQAESLPPKELLPTFKNMSDDKTVWETTSGSSLLNCTGSFKDWTCIPRLHRIAVPTLVYNGEFDTSHNITTVPFFEHIPRVRWVTFQGVGHMCHLEGPETTEKVLRTVGEFLVQTQ